MGRQKTISLTRVGEDNYLEPLLNLEYRYDANIAERSAIKLDYFEQKQIIEKIYRDKLIDFSSQLVEGVQKFADKCININNENLFGINRAENLFGAILNLDMRISDLDPTFDIIEKCLKKKHINVLRIKANLLRKKNFLDLLEPSKQSKRVFIMIEQAETLDRSTTDTFVGHLRNRILDDTSPTETIMILFCLSIQIQVLPFTHLNCFGKMEQIKTDRDVEQELIRDELIRSRDIKLKLTARTFYVIHDIFVKVDASIANIAYMHNHALFEYYSNLESLGVNAKQSSLNLTTGDDHQYLCDQMCCYFELLKDAGMFPDNVGEIYEELFRYEDLGQSREFIDAVLNLNKFPHDSIVRRIDSVVQLSEQFASLKRSKGGLTSILKKYSEKLVNNKDSEKIRKDLINALLEQAESLKNPMTTQSRHLYFADRNALINAALTAFRCSKELKAHLTDCNSYFGIVFYQILLSSAQIGPNDLFNEVIDKFKEMIRFERSQNKTGPRTKSTPKKRGGERAAKAMKTPSNSQKALSDEDEEGIAKAIFVDVVDCMEVHGVIKLDPKAKGRLIKRLVWLDSNEE